MASYKSLEESWERHSEFVHDGLDEQKFEPWHIGYPRADAIAKRVPRGSIVLEMGVNSGGLSEVIMKTRASICYGVDVAEAMAYRARARGVRAFLEPAEKTHFRDEQFDVVVAAELLEHVFDPELITKEAYRVTKYGGVFLGSVPHEESFNSKKCALEEHHYHARIFTEASLRALLEKRFSDVEIVGVPYPKKHHNIVADPRMEDEINSGRPQWYVWTGRKP